LDELDAQLATTAEKEEEGKLSALHALKSLRELRTSGPANA
jgi:hypothetical protein